MTGLIKGWTVRGLEEDGFVPAKRIIDNSFGFPGKGWEYVGMEDTLEDDPWGELWCQCEFCGEMIRYKHWIEHPDGLMIGVGCICCSRMTDSYVAETNEAERRRDMDRIRTLIRSSRWERYRNLSVITYRGYKMKVWDNDDDGFCLQLFAMGVTDWFLASRSYHDAMPDAVYRGYYWIKERIIKKHCREYEW